MSIYRRYVKKEIRTRTALCQRLPTSRRTRTPSSPVKYAESGELVRFSYRVLDPEKAKALNEPRNEPTLIDPAAAVKLVVPSLEKVGKLRQSSAPEAGKIYWMAFSNKGRRVKPGDRVNVVIGNFQATRLVVE